MPPLWAGLCGPGSSRPLENGQRELTGILLRAEEDGQLELQLDEETSVTLEKKECSSVHSVEEDFDEEEE